MVDTLGQIAFELLFVFGAWSLWNDGTSVGYNAAWINMGLLPAMVTRHLGLAYLTTPADYRHRLRPL